MLQILQNIILFFTNPKKLFARFKESSDLKGSFFIVLFFVAITLFVAIKTNEYKDTKFLPIAFFLVAGSGAIFICLGIVFESVYIMLFCKFFHKQIKFTSLISAMIYSSIPIFLVEGILYLTIPLQYSKLLPSGFSNPLMRYLLRQINPFEIWRVIMQVVAVSVLSGLSYKKSILIILSYLVLGLGFVYFVGYKTGLY